MGKDVQKNQTRPSAGTEFMSVFTDRERFVKVVYPILAGVPTAILILFFLDLGDTYRDVLKHFLSPIITGVTSGFILYTLGVKK
ncbi:MAG: hypothetical protein H8D63_01275 [Parcubacteria group bacterium]|nr:hypothetical protein [Parcubacteria group bacterium]